MIHLRKIVWLLVVACFVLVVGALAALIKYGIDDSPRVSEKIALSIDDIARAKALKEKYDPRNLHEREISHLTVSSRDLNILLEYLARRSPRNLPLFLQADFMTQRAELLFTLRLPNTPLGRYINGAVFFREAPGRPEIERITIGRIPLEGLLLKPVFYLADQLARHLGMAKEIRLAYNALQSARFRPDQLTLVYEWREEVARKLVQKGRDLLLSDEDRRRLATYNNLIARIANSLYKPNTSLCNFMRPLFRLADQRSSAMEVAPAENRAAILALTLFVNHLSIKKLIGTDWPEPLLRPKPIETTLRARTDLPKHFMISAALQVVADSSLSSTVGLFKEIDDSMSGSGFSFVDLLADQAGLRFAELSTASEATARQVQIQMGRARHESVFMPDIGGLPEGLMQKTFQKRYRDMDSAAYRAERREIDRRIDACLLHQR